MWEKLNFFGWNKKKEVQPVQREVSITLSNGDRQEVIQRSPSGTKLGSSSVKHGLDDDDSSEGSTSLNFGVKANASPRRNSSYSFSREPLDLPTWSNVTSPGFTSRLVQQASGHSPLKEFNDSLSFSPFRNSPHAHLQLGELPHVSFTRKPKLSPPVFPSPQKSLRSGVSSSVYSRDRRRNARQGTVFVRIAPIDPSTKANISLSGKTPSPNIASPSNGSPYPPRGSPRAGEPYRPEGLGGIPSQELAMRFNRMWSPPPGSAMSQMSGRPSSPTSPSNIVEALTAGRKRVREQDTYYGLPTSGPPSASSPPSKISVGIGDTPARPQMSKRVKFLGAPESQDRPMMVPYSGMVVVIASHFPNIEEQSSTLQSALRKRRNQSNIISANDEDTRGEKLGRFCRCNECYAEAAGVSSFMQPQTSQRSGSISASGSPNKSDDGSTSPGKSNKRETCDRGVSTEPDKIAFFREIFRKPNKKPVEKVDEIMKRPPVVLTKEMYDKDKQKRIERYYRILSMKPPDGSIFDVTLDPVAKPASDVNGEAGKTATTGSTSTTNNGAFSFGSQTPSTSSEGFTFNKQASPTAITNTTSVCSTISSPSSTGNTFGSNSASVTAPLMTLGTSSGLAGAFGTNTTNAPTSLAAVPTGSISFGTAAPSANPGGSFSFGKQAPSNAPATTNSASVGSTNSTTPLSSGTVSASTTETGASSTAPPSYGQSILATGASGGLTFGTTIPKSTTGVSTGGISFGTPASTTTPSTGFSFGKQTTSITPVQNTNTVGSSVSSLPTSTTGNALLGSTTAPAAAPSPFGQALASATSSTGFGSPISTNNDNKTGGAGSSAGFSFSSGSNPSPLLTANNGTTSAATTSTFGTLGPAITSTVSSTTVPTFGLTSSSQPPTFGSGNSSNTGTTLGSNSNLNTLPAPQPSTGGFSFSGAAAQNQGTPVTSSSFGGFNFGQSNNTSTSSPAPAAPSQAGAFQFGQSNPPSGSQTGSAIKSSDASDGTSLFSQATTTSSSTGSTFGSGGLASVTAPSATISSPFGQPLASGTSSSGLSGAFGSTTATTTAPVTGGFSFGSAPSTASGGFSFGKPMAPAAIANTTSADASITSPSSTGNAFGLNNSSNTAASANAASPFGQSFATGAPSGLSTGFGSTAPTNNMNNNKTATTGGFNFASVPNPLAKVTSPAPTFGSFGSSAATTAASTLSTTPGFGSFGSPATTAASTLSSTPGFGSFGGQATTAASTSSTTPSFGSFGGQATTTTTNSFGSVAPTTASQVPVFGSGNNNNAGFSFGSNTMSPPQSQPSTGGFSFGGTAQQQQSAPAPASSSSFGGGFAFGQSSTPAPLPPAPTTAPNPAGVFQFGQPAGNAATAGAAASSPFQFGQQAQQGVPGGFNFAAAAPAGMPNQMFSVGATNTAPRRRDPRRRHR
ncbi:hypothetical protein Ocin01_17458 [Orchesella cincta]|uniref:Nuclear pore complex protein n=1 Tax=Orchesella cincta TaxID=48709 RepID=A0A1D2M8J7_ORCCI|nr:hypothetical protein Ocin01_17458 [Orchesella cincta]